MCREYDFTLASAAAMWPSFPLATSAARCLDFAAAPRLDCKGMPLSTTNDDRASRSSPTPLPPPPLTSSPARLILNAHQNEAPDKYVVAALVPMPHLHDVTHWFRWPHVPEERQVGEREVGTRQVARGGG